MPKILFAKKTHAFACVWIGEATRTYVESLGGVYLVKIKKINSWWFMPRKVVDLSWNDLGFSPRAIQNRLRLLICLIA